MPSTFTKQIHAGLDQGFGLQVAIESFPDIELAFESLASERLGIELLNVRHDDLATLPTTDDEILWWEVWWPVRGDRAAVTDSFRQLAQGLEFRLAKGELPFPERTVLLMQGAERAMKRSMMVLNNIAELRRAKEMADFFDALLPGDQPDWLNDLLARTSMPEPGMAPLTYF